MTHDLALVLGGGGVAGIAWETGVLLGIAEENPAVADSLLAADVLVGTSAGAAVAAQIASGTPLAELFARQTSAQTSEIDPGIAIDDLVGLFTAAAGAPGTRTQKLRRIGEVALAAKTVPEASRRAVIVDRLPSHHWPERILRITAVDTASGELVVFDGAGAAGLIDAVAASCAVPGVWPPVTIGTRRYMDGGMNSTVNMAVAGACRRAVVLVPTPRDAPSLTGVGAVQEIAEFPAPTSAVFADADSLAAFGPNPMDPRCRIPAATAGRAQGRTVAATLAEFLAV